MGTVAEKLTYLNGTKSSLKTAINNLGGDIISSTTFRNYATELNDIYDNLPKVSDTGTNISLTPTLKGRLGIVPKGNTLQDGEPTPDTPVEIQSATGTQKVVVSDNDNNSQTKIINLGNIELNKIGDYEDYIDGTPDNWVLYKNIGKVVLDGSENMWGTIGNDRYYLPFDYKRSLTSSVPCAILSNYFKSANNAGDSVNVGEMVEGYYTSGNKNIFFNYNGSNNDLAGFKTWLSTHNTELLYVLAETQQTPITDTNLVSQLNELYYLQSYNDTTNIDVTGNLPMRITASAIKGE